MMKLMKNQELAPDLYELGSNETARMIGAYEANFLQQHCALRGYEYEGQIGIWLMSKRMSVIKHIEIYHITGEIK